MNEDNARPIREYKGIIWIGDQPGVRFWIDARSLDEAAAILEEQYGEGHVYSLWNEYDAHKPR